MGIAEFTIGGISKDVEGTFSILKVPSGYCKFAAVGLKGAIGLHDVVIAGVEVATAASLTVEVVPAVAFEVIFDNDDKGSVGTEFKFDELSPSFG